MLVWKKRDLCLFLIIVCPFQLLAALFMQSELNFFLSIILHHSLSFLNWSIDWTSKSQWDSIPHLHKTGGVLKGFILSHWIRNINRNPFVTCKRLALHTFRKTSEVRFVFRCYYWQVCLFHSQGSQDLNYTLCPWWCLKALLHDFPVQSLQLLLPPSRGSSTKVHCQYKQTGA